MNPMMKQEEDQEDINHQVKFPPPSKSTTNSRNKDQLMTLSLSGKTIQSDDRDREKMSNDAVKNLLMEGDSSLDVLQSTYKQTGQSKQEQTLNQINLPEFKKGGSGIQKFTGQFQNLPQIKTSDSKNDENMDYAGIEGPMTLMQLQKRKQLEQPFDLAPTVKKL